MGEFVGLFAAATVVPFASHDVEPVRFAPAGQSGVAEFGEQSAVTEQKGNAARHALGLVDGGGIAVGEMPVVEEGQRRIR